MTYITINSYNSQTSRLGTKGATEQLIKRNASLLFTYSTYSVLLAMSCVLSLCVTEHAYIPRRLISMVVHCYQTNPKEIFISALNAQVIYILWWGLIIISFLIISRGIPSTTANSPFPIIQSDRQAFLR